MRHPIILLSLILFTCTSSAVAQIYTGEINIVSDLQGLLGIGVAPTRPLHLVTDQQNMAEFKSAQLDSKLIITSDANLSDTFGPGILIRRTAAPHGWRLESIGTNNGSGDNFAISKSNTPWTRFFVIQKETGNVGIGTSAPGSKLEVVGAMKANTLNLTGGHLSFPSAQVTSSDANTLDDYREGTWQVQPGFINYQSQIGNYTKIGNHVTASFDNPFNSLNKGSGNMFLKLPYPVKAGQMATAIVKSGATICFGIASGGSTTMYLYNSSGSVINANSFGANDSFQFSVSYLTD